MKIEIISTPTSIWVKRNAEETIKEIVQNGRLLGFMREKHDSRECSTHIDGRKITISSPYLSKEYYVEVKNFYEQKPDLHLLFKARILSAVEKEALKTLLYSSIIRERAEAFYRPRKTKVRSIKDATQLIKFHVQEKQQGMY